MGRHDGKRLHQAVKNSSIKVTDFFSLLGVSRGTMYNYFDSEELTDEVKEKVALVLRRSVQDIFGLGNEKDKGAARNDDASSLVYVSIATAHEYAQNCRDNFYVDTMERIHIPGMPYRGEKFRCFEVEGDRMLPAIKDGTQVIAQYIAANDWLGIHDFHAAVVVTQHEVLVCRVAMLDDRRFVLISDNEEQYPQVVLERDKIKELWLIKRILDWRTIAPKVFDIKISR